MSRSQADIKASSHSRFTVHQNAQGYWVASEKDGFVTGIFAVQRDALRFALSHLHRRIAANETKRKAPETP